MPTAISYFPSISGDGRFVAFASQAPDLVAGDTNGFLDIFVVDRESPGLTTQRVSVDYDPTDDDDGRRQCQRRFYSIHRSAATGRFVAFTSWAPDLVAGDTNGF